MQPTPMETNVTNQFGANFHHRRRARRASTSAASACWSPASRPGSASRPPARLPRMAPRSSAPRAISTRPRPRPLARRRGARRRLELVELDLASLASVRACADALIADGRPFDVVIANAGVMATPVRQDRRRLRDPVRHQPPRPFRAGQPHRPLMQAGGRLVNLSSAGPPLRRRRPRRPELRDARPTTVGRLWPLEDRQHPVRGRVRPAPQGPRRARDGGASRRHPDRARPPYDAERRSRRWSTSINADSRPAARRRSSSRRSRKARRPRSGPAWSRRPTRSAATTARTATSPRSPTAAIAIARRRAPLRARSGARQGAVGQERGDGRRALLSAGRQDRGSDRALSAEQAQRVLDVALKGLHEARCIPAVDDAVVAQTATGSSAFGPRSHRRWETSFSSTLLTAMIATSGRLMTGVDVMPPIGPRLDSVMVEPHSVLRGPPCRLRAASARRTISRRQLSCPAHRG